MRDWRKSLGGTPAYRLGHTSLRFQFHYTLLAFVFGSLVLVFLYLKPGSMSSYSAGSPGTDIRLWQVGPMTNYVSTPYNKTYPLSIPVHSADGSVTFRIGLIADLDQQSAIAGAKDAWHSFLLRGHLVWQPTTRLVTVSFDEGAAQELKHHYALKGRGMELSELVTFNGRLLTVDDRTGFVFEIVNGMRSVLPWVVLVDGDGRSSAKGFKSEWATVKDNMLWVGSIGKEWTTASGDFDSFDPMWVKAITTNGHVHHVNWVENYKKLRAALGIFWPGYMIHESGLWSDTHRKWFFLPRRCSKETYNETKDEHNGCNVLITADEHFHDVRVVKLGEFKPTHGFSSMKFIPGTEDRVIVALLSEEVNGETSTFIMAFDTDGVTLMPQQRIDTHFKYEGLEFV